MANIFQKIFNKKEEGVTPTQESGSLKDRFSSIFKKKEPKQEKPFSLVKETIKGLGKKETYKKAYDIGFKSSIKQIINTPKDVLQGTARSGAIAGVTAIGADKVQESKFSKILFGEKPVENVKGSIRNTKADLEKIGISPKISSFSAAPLVLGSIAADLTGGGGVKKVAQEAITNKNVVKPLTKLISENKIRIVRRGDKDVYQVKQGKNWANAKDEESAVRRILKKETPKKEPLTLEQEQERVLLELQREELDRNPAKGLTRFMNKRAGELPEVGAGKGVFARKGDEMAEGLGFDDSETAREATKNFLKNKEDLLAREKEFKQNLKENNKSTPRDLYNKATGKTPLEFKSLVKKPKVNQVDDVAQEARKYKNVDDFIASYKGSGTQYGDYNPSIRYGGTPGSKRLADLGIDPEKEITIYRGIDDIEGNIPRKINDGDFVTTDFQSARNYAGGDKDVVSMKVKAKDLFADDPKEFSSEPFYTGSEYIYSTKQNIDTKDLSKSQLEQIWKEANKTETPTPKAIKEEIIPEPKKEIYTPEKRVEFDIAQKKINDVAINKQERARIVNQAQNVRSQTPIPTLKDKMGRSLDPVKYLDKDTNIIFNERNNSLIKARKLADEEARTLKTPGGKEGYDTIIKYQKGDVTPFSKEIKDKFDSLFREANERTGKTIAYRENYIPQVYKEKPEEIASKISDYLATEKKLSLEEIQDYMTGKPLSENQATRLKLNPTFSKERTFPNYEVARQYGLTPKYTTPSQLAGYYREELETTIANRKFIDTLAEKGKILPLEDAPKDWKAVNLPFSTKGYYAEPQLARTINGLFPDEADKGFTQSLISSVANLSKRAQEIALSAGFPKSNVNFFAIGQLVKEMTAGNFNVIGPFLRANFNSKSIKYFEKNQEYLKKMADQGIDLGDTIASYKTSYKPIFDSRTFREKIGDNFDKLFNEKTFGSFLPQMHLQSFKSIYDSAIKKGLPEKQAEKLAGDTIKKAFGMSDYTGRSKSTEDALSATFFAPKFREGILNTLANTGKSGIDFVRLVGGLRGKLDPAYKKNRKLLAGMIVTYAAYNALNKELNGNYMWDNPDNRKFALQIPRENGELIYVEFMPSFLAFARNLATGAINLASGDIKGAQQKFGSLFSMPVKITTEILANKDYFGNAIYKDTDKTIVKALKIAKYAGLQVNHPYVKEVINQIGDKKPLYQSLIAALELPLKFSSREKVATQEFYKELEKKEFANARLKEQVLPVYENVQKLIEEGDTETAQSIVNEMTDEQYEIYKNMKASDKRRETINSQIQMYDTVKEVRKLIEEGNEAGAWEIVNNLTDEEYKAYEGAKKRLDDSEKKPKIEGEVSETSLIKDVLTYGKAIGVDPVTAFNRIFTGQKIRRVDGRAIIVERMSLQDSSGVKQERGSMGDMKLDHTIPLQLGGSNSENNLKLVSNDEWKSYTPVENFLGEKLRNKEITKKEAQKLISDFKNGLITAEEIYAK